ncbi:hypothetical protein [Streptomyces dubilierae]|uniref:Cardiolipin synthase N-terminal domain-containing protein n=1 Tax=Streptomyces dubilierae TaxID=3075533 RepID=A0ABU2PM81_9ACTN|nr:hypothetical protein [Streptomyces sp. DSM 41921]MDT0392129.1 hypothetical protein [Streptomyces sp. DSM 41921]
MIAVAVLLLPALGVLLYAMDRIEDRLSGRPRAARHARRRHLRLVHDVGPSAGRGRARRTARHSARRGAAA